MRNFTNHLGFTSAVFVPKFQYEFENLATILSAFSFKNGERMIYFFASFADQPAFENTGDPINLKDYQIDDPAYQQSEIFNQLKPVVENIVISALLGDGEHSSEIPLLSAEVESIDLSNISYYLNITLKMPDGTLLPFSRSGAEYDAIIGANMNLIYQIVEMAKTYSKQTDNFFNL